jgi:tRNA 2-selenouridine synthase
MAFLTSSTLIVLRGKTGSGKTLLLQQLESSGYPVINLEKIASHRGSAFGGLLLPPQPSQHDFENGIEKAALNYAGSKYIFIEQKPLSIGKRKIPEWLLAKMDEGIVVQLNVDKKTRIQNILNEYRAAGKKNFIKALDRLDERLPFTVRIGLETLLHSENYEVFIDRMLDYYDNTSKYVVTGNANIILDMQPGNVVATAQQLLKALQLEKGMIGRHRN